MYGQETKIFTTNIRTVTLYDCNGSKKTPISFPVLRLNEDDKIEIDFDDLSHDYQRYTYTLKHLDENFEDTENLFENEYLAMNSNEGIVEDFVQSSNTTVPYLHYSFSIPNNDIKPIISGNYEITMWKEMDGGEKVEVFKTYFCVTENIARFQTGINSDTDIDRNSTHQQITLSVQIDNSKTIRDNKEFSLIVLQNSQWNNAVKKIPPTSWANSPILTLNWQHCKDLIFSAGNEYRKFEIKNTQYPGLHIERINNIPPYYHAILFTDEPRKNYLHDEDQNGIFIPLANDNLNASNEGDYLWVHFSYLFPENWEDVLPKKITIDGQWVKSSSNVEYALLQSPENPFKFEAQFLLKQGYYSYYYWAIDDKGRKLSPTIEGDFYQTENEYTFLLYHKPPESRYTHLIGIQTTSR